MESNVKSYDWRRFGIIPEESFLRRLPAVLDVEQKMRIDYLVYCCDMVYTSYINLINIASYARDDIDIISREMKTNLFLSAWSIVDNIHAARQIIQSLAPPDGISEGVTSEFLKDSEIVRKIRNEMDHLSGNIKKLNKKKGNKSPLFGAVCYVFCEGDVSSGATIVIVKSGHFHGEESWIIPKVGGREFRVPVDFVTLNAFGLECEFAPLIDKLSISVGMNSIKWEQNINDHVDRISKKSGEAKQSLLRHSGGGYAVALKVEFSDISQPGLPIP